MEPVPTDFWGVVVPSWLGALASIAASTVAVMAFINSLSAKGGVREIGAALNREPSFRPGAPALRQSTAVAPEPWSVGGDGRTGIFRNTSDEVLTVTRIAATEGIEATLRDRLPVDVPPSASFEVRLRSGLGSPAVRGVTVDWRSATGESLSRTYYI